MATPTLLSLARQVWTLEIGAHGPIVVAAGGWLVFRALPHWRQHRTPASAKLTGAGFVIAAATYIFGRAFDYISLEGLGLYLMLWVLAYHSFGAPALKAEWFPLAFLGFLVPPPGWALDYLTMPLREAVSAGATQAMQALGYPIANNGVAITIGAYQLLVEEACAGMNSLVGLTAVTLLYIHLLVSATPRYALLLAALVVPLAVAINLARVIVLILLTYHAGDAAAQGFLHGSTGLLLFVVALGAMFALDRILRAVLPTSFVSAAA